MAEAYIPCNWSSFLSSPCGNLQPPRQQPGCSSTGLYIRMFISAIISMFRCIHTYMRMCTCIFATSPQPRVSQYYGACMCILRTYTDTCMPPCVHTPTYIRGICMQSDCKLPAFLKLTSYIQSAEMQLIAHKLPCIS